MLEVSYDRFSVGVADPQDKPLDLVGICPCGCREAIYFGDDDVQKYDGYYFVNADHLANWIGAERMDYQWG